MIRIIIKQNLEFFFFFFKEKINSYFLLIIFLFIKIIEKFKLNSKIIKN